MLVLYKCIYLYAIIKTTQLDIHIGDCLFNFANSPKCLVRFSIIKEKKDNISNVENKTKRNTAQPSVSVNVEAWRRGRICLVLL